MLGLEGLILKLTLTQYYMQNLLKLIEAKLIETELLINHKKHVSVPEQRCNVLHNFVACLPNGIQLRLYI